MDVIIDPDMQIIEVPVPINHLIEGDVFRSARLSLAEAMESKRLYLRIAVSGKMKSINIFTNHMVDLPSTDAVIVHAAKVVVLPND